VVKVVAKSGYAVGAITVKAGLGVDGFSITFMKVEAGQLNPKDSYESEWIGGKGGGRPTKLAGDGGVVVGVVGKTNKTNAGGIGLLVLPRIRNSFVEPLPASGLERFFLTQQKRPIARSFPLTGVALRGPNGGSLVDFTIR
jgi:hypothetical protein